VSEYFDHEKLDVYQLAVRCVREGRAVTRKVPERYAVKNQFERAMESVSINIAESTGRTSQADRAHFIDTARGSCAEAAACLDIAVIITDISEQSSTHLKKKLSSVSKMLTGLRKSGTREVREKTGEYNTAEYHQPALFDHEKLQVYQRALDFIRWSAKTLPFSQQLDRSYTSLTLNIAEGNAKYSAKDRLRFFRQARSATLKSAALLDICLSADDSNSVTLDAGKSLLSECVRMLVGLEKHFKRSV